MRYIFALLCTALMLIIFGGMGQIQPTQPTVTVPPIASTALRPADAATVTNTTAWKTYTNSVLGFSIAYPESMHLENYRSIADNQGFGSPSLCGYGNHNISLVVCFRLPQEAVPSMTEVPYFSDYTRASFAVNTSNLEQADCLSFEDNQYQLSTGSMSQNSINGINFVTLTTTAADAYDGTHTINVRNRTFIRNTCFELLRTIARRQFSGVQIPPVTPTVEPAKDSQYQFVQALFDQMITSFHFIAPNPPTSAADLTAISALSSTATLLPTSMMNWKTYTNSIFGFSITYPPTMQLVGYKEVPSEYVPLCNSLGGNTSLIICLYLPRDTYPDTSNTAFRGGSLAISTTNLDEEDCLSYSHYKSDGFRTLEPTLINGIRFTTLKTGGAGGGHWGTNVYHHTFMRNTCFVLDTTIAGMSFTEFLPTSTPGATLTPYPNYQNFDALFEQVVGTFYFTTDQTNKASP